MCAKDAFDLSSKAPGFIVVSSRYLRMRNIPLLVVRVFADLSKPPLRTANISFFAFMPDVKPFRV